MEEAKNTSDKNEVKECRCKEAEGKKALLEFVYEVGQLTRKQVAEVESMLVSDGMFGMSTTPVFTHMVSLIPPPPIIKVMAKSLKINCTFLNASNNLELQVGDPELAKMFIPGRKYKVSISPV